MHRPARPVAMIGPLEAWAWLSFFESYFSNFIEGTEFGIEEVRRIAADGEVPADRPADARDLAATNQLTSDPVDQFRTHRSGDQLVENLADRHRVLMAVRTIKRPWEIRVKPNYQVVANSCSPNWSKGLLPEDSTSSTLSPTRLDEQLG